MPANIFCFVCFEKFDFLENIPWNCQCGKLSVCTSCHKRNMHFKCEKCKENAYYSFTKETFEEMFEEMKRFEKLIDEKDVSCKDVEDKLSMSLKNIEEKDQKIGEMAKKLEKLEKLEKNIVEVKCFQCGFVDDENMFNICRTCTTENSKIDVLDCDNLTESKIKLFAICSTCSIRKHFREGHEVVDFYPILASINFKRQSIASKAFNEKLSKVAKEIKLSSENWVDLVENGKNIVNSMTDMVGRANSSIAQKELGAKIEENFKKIFLNAENVVEILDETANEFSYNLNSFKTKNSKLEDEQCTKDDNLKEDSKDGFEEICRVEVEKRFPDEADTTQCQGDD